MSLKVEVKQEGPKVLAFFSQDGKSFVLELEAKVAEQLGGFLIQKAKLAAEIEEAERIALDSAILYRAGAPFGLSNHPAIKELAKTEAAWNGNLRRYMMGGVKSREAFGTPKVIRFPARRNHVE